MSEKRKWSYDSALLRREAIHTLQEDENFRAKHPNFYRAAEIAPGLLVWTVLIGSIVLAFWQPFILAICMWLYVIAWLFRSIRFTYYLAKAFPRFNRSLKTPWGEMLRNDSKRWHRSQQLRHVILAATYKEEAETLARGLRMLAESTYPLKQVIYVLATEGRDHDNATKVAKQLKKEFGHLFEEFIITEHPADIEGEAKGKGTNISWAGRVAEEYCMTQGYDPSDVLVTSIDADHRLHPEYLAALTWSFLEELNPDQVAFVSVALFFNNVWDVPSPVRFIHFSSSLWMMVTSVWISRLQNVMTQTQTLTALKRTGYYSPISAVEDGNQYWRSLFAIGTRYKVKMVLMPVYSDAVLTSTFWGTLKEQYLQRRRWHYGVSDVPYVLSHFVYDPRARNLRVFLDLIRLWDGHFGLATSSILLGVVGWIPIWLVPTFRQTVLGLNFSTFYALSLRYAMLGTVLIVIIAVFLVPPKYKDRPASKLFVLLDYIVLPVQVIFYIILAASVPSLDAHTRLMLGKYLGFRVTTKAVSKRTDLSVA